MITITSTYLPPLRDSVDDGASDFAVFSILLALIQPIVYRPM